MKKLISLLCVITLLLSQFVVASACSKCSEKYCSPIAKTAFIRAKDVSTYNGNFYYLRKDSAKRGLILLELNLDNLRDYLKENDTKKGIANYKFAGLSLKSFSGTFTVAIYKVDNFDWSSYGEYKVNEIDYEGEDKLPFNKKTDLINTFTFTVTPERTVLDISEWIEQKLIEGKKSVTIALDNITTDHDETLYFGRHDIEATKYHPLFKHRRVESDSTYQLRDGNFNTTITDGYLFPDKDGTNYVFAKYQLGNETSQEVTDLGIQIGDTFYSLKKDTAEFNQALTSRCFGIGIKDSGKTLGNSYKAIPQIKMRDVVKEDVYNNTFVDDGFVKSGEGITVNQ